MKNKKMNMLAQQALDDLDVIMRTENGRRFIYAILESTEVETAVFSIRRTRSCLLTRFIVSRKRSRIRCWRL